MTLDPDVQGYERLNRFLGACRSESLGEVTHIAEELGYTRETDRAEADLALRAACDRGRTDLAEWLTEHFGLTRADARSGNYMALWSACQAGQLASAQWIVAKFGLDPIDVHQSIGVTLLIFACRIGKLDLAVWLTEWLGFTAADVRGHKVLAQACHSGHLSTVQWLVGHFGLTVTDGRAGGDLGLREACKLEYLEVAHWLLDWTEPGPAERQWVLTQSLPSPAVEALLTGWQRPPGPEDKPALQE